MNRKKLFTIKDPISYINQIIFLESVWSYFKFRFKKKNQVCVFITSKQSKIKTENTSPSICNSNSDLLYN